MDLKTPAKIDLEIFINSLNYFLIQFKYNIKIYIDIMLIWRVDIIILCNY